jgi:predicted DNA-binding protein
MYDRCMKRINVYLSEKLIAKIKERSEQTDRTFSQLLRDAIEEGLYQWENEDHRLSLTKR